MSDNNKPEMVLVFDKETTTLIRKAIATEPAPGLAIDKNDAISTLIHTAMYTPGCVEYKERSVVEPDTDYLQIIPYVAVVNRNKEVLVYERTKKGGDSRLHNKASIGFGGHINPYDSVIALGHKLVTGNTYNITTVCAMRELDEELCSSGKKSPLFLTRAFIYDDSNNVSKVHLGIILVAVIDYTPESKEDKLENVRFETIENAKKIENLESWSSILLESLDEHADMCIARLNELAGFGEEQAEEKTED